MFITLERIRQLAPRAPVILASGVAQTLEAAMPKFEVNTLLRRAHFMAQVCWETEYFQHIYENLNYLHATAIAAAFPHLAARAADLVGKPEALGNAAYADRNGNGDEASGDGWLYRGRGLFDLTGKANYAAAADALQEDYVRAPDHVATRAGAALTALWFWKTRGCNEAADMDDVGHVTHLINGPARDGLTQRAELTEDAKKIFI